MRVKLKVIPNSKKTEIKKEITLFGEEVLKVKLLSSPIEGKANKELLKILSGYYKVSKSKIKILKGEKSREKIIEIKEGN